MAGSSAMALEDPVGAISDLGKLSSSAPHAGKQIRVVDAGYGQNQSKLRWALAYNKHVDSWMRGIGADEYQRKEYR
jgi:hypothetical protein